jgi:hypothetical protein
MLSLPAYKVPTAAGGSRRFTPCGRPPWSPRPDTVSSTGAPPLNPTPVG